MQSNGHQLIPVEMGVMVCGGSYSFVSFLCV